MKLGEGVDIPAADLLSFNPVAGILLNETCDRMNSSRGQILFVSIPLPGFC